MIWKFRWFVDYYIDYLKSTGKRDAEVYIDNLSVRPLEISDIKYFRLVIGNCFLDQYLLGNSMLQFTYYHGLLDYQTYDFFSASAFGYIFVLPFVAVIVSQKNSLKCAILSQKRSRIKQITDKIWTKKYRYWWLEIATFIVNFDSVSITINDILNKLVTLQVYWFS